MCPLNSEFEKRVIWNFAEEVAGRPAENWRKDACGSLICWSEYGQSSAHGWKIVAAHPERSDISISNKQAMHWKNVRSHDPERSGKRRKAEG